MIVRCEKNRDSTHSISCRTAYVGKSAVDFLIGANSDEKQDGGAHAPPPPRERHNPSFESPRSSLCIFVSLANTTQRRIGMDGGHGNAR